MKTAIRSLLALPLVLFAACSSADAPSGPGTPSAVVGTWAGATSGATLSMTLTETGGVVSGTATYTKAPSAPVVLDVQGTFASPSLSAQMPSGGVSRFSLATTVSGTTMVGALTETGAAGQYITLAKQ